MARQQMEMHTRQFAERPIKREITSFAKGMIYDLPITEIPDNAVADSENWILLPGHGEVRSGTLRIASTALPARITGISASKSSTTITVTAGTTPASADIGSYFVHDDGANDLITAVNSNTYTVSSSTARAASTAAKVRDEVNACEWHAKQCKFILFIGQKVYYATAAISAWTEVTCLNQAELPTNTKSTIVIRDQDALLFNTNGLYMIEMSATVPHFYKINNTIPEIGIGDIAATDTLKFARRYLMTYSKFSGSALLNRLGGNTLVHESGPTVLNSDGIDYAEVATEKPIGKGIDTYGVLTGTALGASYDTVAEWEVITNGAAKFTINNATNEIHVDFSGCQSWNDVAGKIQTALRDYWPSAKFEFDTNHFILTMEQKDSAVTYCTAPGSGTDISGALELDTGSATISNEKIDQTSTQIDIIEFESVATKNTGNELAGFTFANKMWVIGSNGGSAYSYNSVDGITWSQNSETTSLRRFLHGAATLGNTMYIYGGMNSEDLSLLDSVYSSTDGLTWSLVTDAPTWSARYSFGYATFKDKIWIIGGIGGSGYLDDVYSSTDGSTWTLVAGSPGFDPVACHGCVVVHNGSLFLVGGLKSGGAAHNKVYSSSDGATWTVVCAATPWTAAAGMRVVSDGFKIRVGIGTNWWESEDGIDWKFSGTTDYNAFGAVLLAKNGYLYAIGTSSGAVYRSPFITPFVLNPQTYLSGENYYFSNQYTHYSVYATEDIGENGINQTTGKGNNPEQYVWLEDVPLVKSFVVTTTAAGIVTASKGSFSRYDVGCTLEIAGNAISGIIKSYTSSAVVEWNQTAVLSSVGATIGTQRPFVASQSSYTVTAATGTPFTNTSTDKGKLIFWSDGTFSIVSAVTSTSICTVLDSTSRTSMGGGILDSPNAYLSKNVRGFCDTVTDDELGSRISRYALKNRLWTALSNNNIGVNIPGFLVGAIRDGRRIEYCQTGFPELIGYHASDLQYDVVDDAIRALRVYPTALSAICTHSTTSWDPENVAQERPTNIVETVYVLAQKRVVDTAIGCMAYGSIAKVENGVDVMLTNDHEIRLFNGAEYGPNIAANRFMKLLRKLQPVCTASYDPIGGYYLWGTEAALITVGSNTVIAFPDKCYRFALNEQQGVVGGIRITGTSSSWVAPPDMIGGLTIYDSNNNNRQVVLDNLNGTFYWISTYDGPTGSGLSKCFLDKSTTGSDGTEISANLWLKGHTGTTEQHFIRHIESRFYFRPYKESNRDASGHDSNGYRTGTQIDVYIFRNNDPDDYVSDTRNITKDGDIVTQANPEANVLQIKLASNRSEVMYIGSLHRYASSERAADPSRRTTTEGTAQSDLASPTLWYSRGKDYDKNRVTGTALTGTVTAATGPDSKTNSAMQFTAAITLGTVTITSGTIFLWTYGTVALTIGGVAISLTSHAAIGDWTFKYATAVTASGSVVLTPTGTARVCDVRIYNSAIT